MGLKRGGGAVQTPPGGIGQQLVCASPQVHTPVSHVVETLSVLPGGSFGWPVCFCGLGFIWSFCLVIPLGAPSSPGSGEAPAGMGLCQVRPR